VERKAVVMARGMIADREEALDIVQDAMMRFVRSYSDRPEKEWRPLFFRIVINRVRDWQRRKRVSSRIMSWFRAGDQDPVETAPAAPTESPEAMAIADESLLELERGVRDLSTRQQQAFVLRCLEGMNVAATAEVMRCSTGSVKTHYSRALASLRARLGSENHG
jgi:RNA polymerase sigma-70 factor (ECF subfamily)